MNKTRTIWWVAGCAVALNIGACRSASTRIYTLEPTAPLSRIDGYHAPALRIDTLSLPADWDRSEMLEPSTPGTFQIRDFDQWAAPLAHIVRHTLSEDLDLRLPSGSVIYPRLPKPSDALGVDVDILEFNIVASHASMRASWLIVPSGNSQRAKRNSAELGSPMSGEKPADVARAWSDLVGQLADQIAADATSFN